MNSDTLNWDTWWHPFFANMIKQVGWRQERTAAAEESPPWTYQKDGWCRRTESKEISKIKNMKDGMIRQKDEESNDFEKGIEKINR